MVGLVVLNYNDWKTTEDMVDSVLQYQTLNKIVVVDNNSTDYSYEKLSEKYSNIDKVSIVKSDRNGGYGYGNNYGIKYLNCNYGIKRVLICNPDVIFNEECVIKLKDALDNYEEAAVVSPKMLDKNKNEQNYCVWRIPTTLNYTIFSLLFLGKLARMKMYYNNEYLSSHNVVEVDCVAGSMLMIDLSKFGDNHVYDENIFLYCEETVLGINVKNRNKKTYLVGNTSFIHNHSVSIDKSFPKELSRLKIMWKSRIYVLRKYMKIKPLLIPFVYITYFICVLETWLISKFKRIRKA